MRKIKPRKEELYKMLIDDMLGCEWHISLFGKISPYKIKDKSRIYSSWEEVWYKDTYDVICLLNCELSEINKKDIQAMKELNIYDKFKNDIKPYQINKIMRWQ